jgi:hypothetical protein
MSHTILVIDSSGSMRNVDVSDGGSILMSRHTATLNALSKGLFIPQLQAGVESSDVVTMIKLGEAGELMLNRVPFKEAAVQCVDLLRSLQPRSPGNYLPSLDKLGEVLRRSTTGVPTNVLFFSDGKPSDQLPPGPGTPKEKLQGIIVRKTNEVCGGRANLKLHTVGFGTDDFSMLKAMSAALPAGVGTFHNSGLSLHALTRTLSTFSSSVTESRLTASAGPARELRPVLKLAGASKWETHVDACAWLAPDGLDARWEAAGTYDVCICEAAFDAGGERNVFRLKFERGGPAGEWVAKENKHVEHSPAKELEFHKKSLVTQAFARTMGKNFNAALRAAGWHSSLPSVEFVKPYLLKLNSGRLLFLEPYAVRIPLPRTPPRGTSRWSPSHSTALLAVSWMASSPNGTATLARSTAQQWGASRRRTRRTRMTTPARCCARKLTTCRRLLATSRTFPRAGSTSYATSRAPSRPSATRSSTLSIP